MKSKTSQDNRGDPRDWHERRIEEKRDSGTLADPPAAGTQPKSVSQIAAESKAQVDGVMESETPPSSSAMFPPPGASKKPGGTAKVTEEQPKADPSLTEMRNEQDDLRVPIPYQPRKQDRRQSKESKAASADSHAKKNQRPSPESASRKGGGSVKKQEGVATTESLHLASGLMGSQSTRRAPTDGSKPH